MLFAVCAASAVAANAQSVDLTTGTGAVIATHGVRLSDLTYDGGLLSADLYLNLDGSWSLAPPGEEDGLLDLSTGHVTVSGADQLTFSGITYGGGFYDAIIALGLDGTWNALEVSAVDGFTLSSPAVKGNGILPFTYTCDGLDAGGERGGQSPALAFSHLPEGTGSLAVTMHIDKGEGDRITTESLWVLYDIPASTTSLAADGTGGGTLGVTEQGENAYFPPCSHEPVNNEYTLTAYALPAALGLSADGADYATVTAAAQASALAKATLVLSRIRYNPDSDEDLQVPTAVPSTCEEKAAAFADYSVESGTGEVSVACDGTTMTVTSYTGLPSRSSLDEDKPNVGTEAWIGRVPLTRTRTWSFPVVPSYIEEPTSNVSIHDPIGVTVDGIPMLHYAKEDYNGEIADINTDYSARDTVLLGELDQCGAHAGNGEDYHYHYAPLCMMDAHDPSKPLAYMFDGIPLYFGTAGGTVTDRGGITAVNYGGGRYDNLDYRPTAVKTGAASLDACNAYDINGDGAVSGWVYYTTKTPPYTIGCYRGVADQTSSSNALPRWDTERDISWSGSDVLLSDYYTAEFQGTTWTFMEIQPGSDNHQIAAGNTAAVLYRPLTEGESGYVAGSDCWIFRYRLDKSDTAGANDTVESVCR
ncbi:YHYH protein [Endothiovibrio diazotrophicus]